MDDTGDTIEISSEALSSDLVKESGSRNKRKFIPDPPPETSDDDSIPTLSLEDLRKYQNLEAKFRNVVTQLGSMIKKSENKVQEEEEEQECQEANWEDPFSFELLELLTNKLFEILRDAVKNISSLGYTEEAAEWAVLNSGLFHGNKDAVSNVVDGALALLATEKNFDASSRSVFKELKNLVEFTFLEMIHVLREIRPDFDIADAMWCLLVSDLNLLNACVVNGRPPTGPTVPKSKDEKASLTNHSESDSNKTENSEAQSSKPEPFSCSVHHQVPNSDSPSDESNDNVKENSLALLEAKGKALIQEEISGGSKKDGSSDNSKLRQKTLNFEKNCKGRTSKGSFKAKVSSSGSMVMDKTIKPQSGTGNSQQAVRDALYAPKPETDALQPETNPKPPTSSNPIPNPNPSRKENKTEKSNLGKESDYYTGIPYEETLKKYVPKDNRDKTILMLVPRMLALDKEHQSWRNWAHNKVIQTLNRLDKDKAELRMLRQEKEEAEKCVKERETMEENARKRLCEMENALSNFNGQLEVAIFKARRLEHEKALLINEKETAYLQSSAEATKLEKNEESERMNLKKLQSVDAEKSLFLEKQTNVKRKQTELESLINKVQARKDQFEVLWKHEAKKNEKTTKQMNSFREKREEGIALRNKEEENVTQMAKTNLNKCEENIKSLQNKISAMRSESDKRMIASLNIGYESGSTQLPKVTKRLAVFEGNFGGLKPERECVMCMNKEISVVFLPCAHQVLCEECSELHEKGGMNDCPSCRKIIEKRIYAAYRA